MSKYKDEEVQEIIGKYGYTFKGWVKGCGQKRKVVSICPNGEDYSFYLDNFIRLNRRCTCEKCYSKNRWTENKISELCNSNDIQFLEFNKEDKRKINIKCKNGNITSPYLGTFVKNPHCNCEDCGGYISWTEERIKQEIEPEGYTYLSKYVKKPSNHTMVKSICPSGNEYLINIVNFHNKRKRRCQCEDCTGVINWSEEKIKSKVENAGYEYLGFEIRKRYEKHIFMKCKNGNVTDSIIPNLEVRNWTCSCDECTGRNTYSKENIIIELENNGYKYVNHYYDETKHLRVQCICPNDNFYESNWWNFANEDVRCPCCKTKSKGEKKIAKEFKKQGIIFKREHIFPDCKYIYPLKFDFVVYTDKTRSEILFACEYDGIQHTSPQTFGGISKEQAEENFKLTVIRDNIKNEYCKTNNIILIRVPYTLKLKDIYNYIENKLFEYHGINISDFFISTEEPTNKQQY